MKINEWMPLYHRIIQDFGYSEEMDRRGASVLNRLLERRRTTEPEEIERRIKGRRILIIGPAAILKTEIKDSEFDTIISADGGIKNAKYMGLRTDIIVTDLDAPADALEMEFDAGRNGAIMIIHAHGDNIPALEKYLPNIEGRVMGTTQTIPFGKMHNFGGFTDGDRAAAIAAHFGAREIALTGFNLKEPVLKDGRNMKTKKKKLEWAERIIRTLNPQPYILHRDDAP